MLRITEDPSSGSLVQDFAKITKMVLSCPLIRTWSVLWQQICCHNTSHVYFTLLLPATCFGSVCSSHLQAEVLFT